MTTAATPAHDLRISHLAVRCIADRTNPGLRVPTCTAGHVTAWPYSENPARGGAPIGPEKNRMYGYTQNKNSCLARLRRIEGQIRGRQRIIEDDKCCIDVLTQVAAAAKALQSVALGLLKEHPSHCVAGAIAVGGDDATAKVREASEAIIRLVRS
jgi:CsoR family transcriptional regulator, copper-sensing transcriptional repressor